jgi:hypothetical protein
MKHPILGEWHPPTDDSRKKVAKATDNFGRKVVKDYDAKVSAVRKKMRDRGISS